MNPIQLGIKFVRGYEPAPVPDPVPGTGTGATSGLAQTGDIKVALIAGLILLALTIVGMVAYAFIKNRKLAGANSSISTVFKQLNFSNFSMRAKVVGALMMILAVTCILLGCFSTNAHAADGEGGPLVPDKSEITATVAEDGTFTLDTCTLTNNGTEKYTIEKSSVSIAQDATDIEGLDQTNLTIKGFGDGKTVFTGKPGNPSEYTPIGLENLASEASTTLTFAIDLPDDVDIETLLDKQVFTISFMPKLAQTEHDITINCEPNEAVAAGCKATAEPLKATKGATVTLTATAGDDYEFDSYVTSPQLTITDNTFTMPPSDVTITAKFKLITHTINLLTDGNGALTCNLSFGLCP